MDLWCNWGALGRQGQGYGLNCSFIPASAELAFSGPYCSVDSASASGFTLLIISSCLEVGCHINLGFFGQCFHVLICPFAYFWGGQNHPTSDDDNNDSSHLLSICVKTPHMSLYNIHKYWINIYKYLKNSTSCNSTRIPWSRGYYFHFIDEKWKLREVEFFAQEIMPMTWEPCFFFF